MRSLCDMGNPYQHAREVSIVRTDTRSDLQVVAVIDDLAQGSPKSFYELATEARSGQTPGAGPTLAFGPYGAAARFVMAGQDLDQNVRQTASQIATRVAQHVGPGKSEKQN